MGKGFSPPNWWPASGARASRSDRISTGLAGSRLGSLPFFPRQTRGRAWHNKRAASPGSQAVTWREIRVKPSAVGLPGIPDVDGQVFSRSQLHGLPEPGVASLRVCR